MGANVDEGSEVVIREKLGRKCAVGVGYCTALFFIFV
jgi:hypothetical protein